MDRLEAIFEIRRQRLALLVESAGGRKSFIEEASKRAAASDTEIQESIRAFMNEGYLGRALGGPLGAAQGKNIGEEPATAFEVLFHKPEGWMSGYDKKAEWPFKFSRQLWDSMRPEERELAEKTLLRQIRGTLLETEQTQEDAPTKVGT